MDFLIGEVEAEFMEGAGLLDSADQMDTLLTDTLSPEEVSALMGGAKQAAPDNAPPPVWSEIETLDPSRLGAFLAVMDNPEYRKTMGFDETSVILLFSTEGDTDPDHYKAVVAD